MCIEWLYLLQLQASSVLRISYSPVWILRVIRVPDLLSSFFFFFLSRASDVDDHFLSDIIARVNGEGDDIEAIHGFVDRTVGNVIVHMILAYQPTQRLNIFCSSTHPSSIS